MESWVFIACACGIILIRAGLLMLNSGLCRSKNASNAVMRVFADMSAGLLAFWLVGAAILLQTHNAYFGLNMGLLAADGSPSLLYYSVCVIIAGGIAGGVMAERTRFGGTPIISIVLAGLLVPIVGRWVFGGVLAQMGFTDVAGASVFHLTGAMVGLVAAMFVGPRTGKYNHDGSSNGIPGHNVPMTMTGTMLMVAGWIPFVLGGVAAHQSIRFDLAAMNTLLAGAAGVGAAMLYCRIRYGKPEIFLMLTGLVAALVAISAAAGTIPTWAAVLTGAVSALAAIYMSVLIDLRWHIDDPTGAVSMHGVGAVTGLLLAGLLQPGSLIERLGHLGIQAVGILAIAAICAIVALGTLAAIRATIGLRSREDDEFDGLDLADHDVNAYPDFQQTTIKSYHLREA